MMSRSKVISFRGLSSLIILVNYCVLMCTVAAPAVLILLGLDKSSKRENDK